MSKIEKLQKIWSHPVKAWLLVLMVHLSAIISAQTSGADGFEVLGLGGAGGMFTPATSPNDPDFMLLSCDMSGSYRSLDGGKSWQMIHNEQVNTSRSCRPMFVGDSIFWISGGQLRLSRDKGENWKAITGGQSALNSSVTCLAHLPGNPVVLFAGAGSDVFVSENGGQIWKSGVRGSGSITALAASGNIVFAAFGSKIHKSSNKGTTWNVLTIPGTNSESITGLATSIQADSQVVYAVVAKGGLFRSTDNGDTWMNVLKTGDTTVDGTVVSSDLASVFVPSKQLDIAYLQNSHQIFKTEDGGETWAHVFPGNFTAIY